MQEIHRDFTFDAKATEVAAPSKYSSIALINTTLRDIVGICWWAR
jgi:hypothetical protein